MTDKEAIDRVANCGCFDGCEADWDCEDCGKAYDQLKKICEREDKYRWHDLRKDPEDLPEEIATNVLTISMDGTYIVRTYEGISIKGFLDSYGHDLKTHQRYEMQVAAWREIEHFEVNDED